MKSTLLIGDFLVNKMAYGYYMHLAQPLLQASPR